MEASDGQLRWRCRRGMKELDLMLVGWLERHHGGASMAQRRAFRDFLELPDPLIAAYLLGREIPEEPEVRALVAEIGDCRPAAGT